MVQLCAVVSLSCQSVQTVVQPQLSLLLFNTSVLKVVSNSVLHFLTADFQEAVIRLTLLQTLKNGIANARNTGEKFQQK
jgi:uncharacterized protein YaaW (UPF0174 family)